jgi:hypothetical protein
MQDSTVSKKATLAMAGITIISAQTDFKCQVVLAVVVVIAITVQGWLDLKKKS